MLELYKRLGLHYFLYNNLCFNVYTMLHTTTFIKRDIMNEEKILLGVPLRQGKTFLTGIAAKMAELERKNEKLKGENKELRQKIHKMNIVREMESFVEQGEVGEIIRLQEEIERLKTENQMLRTTIGRNEAYIKRLTNKSKWSN